MNASKHLSKAGMISVAALLFFVFAMTLLAPLSLHAQQIQAQQTHTQQDRAQQSASAQAVSAPPAVLTLPQAIKRGMENNRAIRIAALQQDNAAFRKAELFARLLPQVNGSAGIDDYIDLPVSFLPRSAFSALIPSSGMMGGTPPPQASESESSKFLRVNLGVQWNASVGVEATQVLYSHALFAGLQLVNTGEELAALALEQERDKVAQAITAAYYGAYTSRISMKILDGNLENIAKASALADANFRNGIIRKTDVDKLAIAKSNLESQRQNIRTAHEQQLLMLKFLTGTPFDAVLQLQDSLETTLEDSNETGMTAPSAELPSKRIELSLLAKQRELADLEEASITAEYFPSLLAYGRYQYSAVSTSAERLFSGDLTFPVSVIGLKMTIPIFDGLAKKARIQQAGVKRATADLHRSMMQENISMEVRNAVNKLRVSQMTLTAQQANISLAGRVYTQVLAEYKSGVASMNDLLNADNASKEAQVQYVNALASRLMASLELKKALGTIR
jgi:outer membrane protein